MINPLGGSGFRHIKEIVELLTQLGARPRGALGTVQNIHNNIGTHFMEKNN